MKGGEIMTKGRRILVEKIDLDTAGTAYLLGVNREDMVEVLRGGVATAEDLANADVICIEVGGSGQVQFNNWDHHAEGGPFESATLQAYWEIPCPSCGGSRKGIDPVTEAASTGCGWAVDGIEPRCQASLVAYINQVDTKGFRSLPGYGKVEFPTLSDVFAGMLLTERNPVGQLHKGVELLKAVVESGEDPYGTISGFDSYAAIKAENNRQITVAVEEARWDTTRGGLKLAYLETDFFGAPGALYGNGAEVVVAYSPHFGPAGVPKFTVAGNGIKVGAVLPALNALESGWGGPPTGTILGSPREGSKLSLEEVVRIVKEML